MCCAVIDFCLVGETLLHLLPSTAVPQSSRATKMGHRRTLSSASLPFNCILKIQLLPMWPAHTDISNPNVAWTQHMVSVPMASGLQSPRDKAESSPGLVTSALAQGWYHTHPYKCACCSLPMFKCIRLLQAYKNACEKTTAKKELIPVMRRPQCSHKREWCSLRKWVSLNNYPHP